ncbi:MAG: ABC transporter substrate-binding protein [Alphaproteobacteria bacterium]|nr:ABC transporter substrate-binding protein [Alphaproteobacteria bacterium]
MKGAWRQAVLLAAATFVLAAVTGAAAPPAAAFIEPPMLEELVKAGKLPAIDQRLPKTPAIAKFGGERAAGKHGGELRMLIGRSREVRLMVVYGYARLVAYNEKLELEPDLLERFEVKDERDFTFHLRPGHKWSDGHPFTVEDFRYWWEDVANNKYLSPTGVPIEMLVDGEAPKFQVINETTVRFTWSKPNTFFMPRMAGASPLFVFRPAHYLRKFHAKYASEAELNERVGGVRNWATAHNKQDNLYEFDNPELPTLQPWVNITKPPATRFRFDRNPYFHRVDEAGRQLPYIDRVIMAQASPQLIAAKTGAGEVDLQARGIQLSNYPFLKEGEKRNNYQIYLWREAKGSHLTLFPNLNINDPEWRKIFRDVRFRRALSLAIDRGLINQSLYFGLAIESANTVLPESPLFKDEYQKKWINFDLRQANRLLDEMGLTKKTADGVRLLPAGRPMEIIIETAGENEEETDVLQLVKDTWAKIGINLFIKSSQREVFRNRIFAGETQMSVWTGLGNGRPAADFSPIELAPTSQQAYQWPKWGQFYETKGTSGEKPDVDFGIKLMQLNDAWNNTQSIKDREKIWHEMLAIHADQVLTIGIVSGVQQPVIVRNSLRNVPKEAMYSWDPGAYFGVYRPDTFWFDR